MSEAFELWEKPEAEAIFMLAGWRQWADAGGVSSALPRYLVQQTSAKQIGALRPDGFYLFQIPGTHDLVRPTVKFAEGYPESLQTRRNEFHYAEVNGKGLVVFLGDEPHLDIERYVTALLDAAQSLNVSRIIAFGGVYGELPYEKERMISAVYSRKALRDELEPLALNFSDYQGGASIGSYLCKRAGEREIDYVGMYAFVPTYDFSNLSQIGNTIRIEKDYLAWMGVMRRVDYLLKLGFDLSDLERKSEKLIQAFDEKVAELDETAPQLHVRDYFKRLSDEFDVTSFDPLDEIWEEEMRRLFDKFEGDEPE